MTTDVQASFFILTDTIFLQYFYNIQDIKLYSESELIIINITLNKINFNLLLLSEFQTSIIFRSY